MNKRVLVYDMDTGAFKRGWGGHGMPLSEISNDPLPPYDWKSGPPPDIKDLATLHCIHVSRDGLVYVCERGSDRVQVFTKQGKFVHGVLRPSLDAGPRPGMRSWQSKIRHLRNRPESCLLACSGAEVRFHCGHGQQ